MNHLPQRQNEPRFLALQAAVKALYGHAERLFYLQAILTVALPVAFSVVLLVVPHLWPDQDRFLSTLKAAAALYGLVVLLVDDLVLDELQQDTKKKAAVIQEMFDADLYELGWRKGKVGQRTAPAEVDRLARRWKRRDPDYHLVRDWYPAVVGDVPLYVARVICQRMNIWWDSGLRRRYAAILGGFASVLATGVAVVCVFLGLSAADMVISATTVLPAFRWALRERKRQRAAMKLLEGQDAAAKDLTEDVLHGRISEADAQVASRELQDDTFDRRRNSPIGFRWLYSRHRDDRESGMVADATECVQIYKHHREAISTSS